MRMPGFSWFVVMLVGVLQAQDPTTITLPAGGNPLASTAERLFPLPTRFFQKADSTAPSGVRSAYPADAMATPRGARAVDFSAFNFADGHSPTAPMLVHFGVDVDPRFLVNQRQTEQSLAAAAPITLFDMQTGERVPLLTEMDQNLRSAQTEGRHPLILRPMVPMAYGTRHLAVLTTELRDVDGHEIPVPPGFRALRDRIPTDHPALEDARSDYERLFTFLAEHDYPRDRLLLAFDFMVASRDVVLGGILSMRDQALEQVEAKGFGYRLDKVEQDPNDNVAVLVQGSFEVPWFLDDDHALARSPDGTVACQADTQWLPFSMVLPPQVRSGATLPLVLFGHGIFGTGQGYLAGGLGRERIQPVARRGGSALLATDFIGLSGSDRQLLVRELLSDLNRMYVMTDRLQQSLINNLVLVETVLAKVQRDVRLGFDGRPIFDSERVGYYGVSLGGCQGIGLAALSKRISRAFLAVPGGAWGSMMSRSIVFSPFKAMVDKLYPDPLLQQVFITLLQARFDGCDGANLGALLAKAPLVDAPRDRRVVLMEAIGDCQVPNLCTRIAARAIGVRQLVPLLEPVFGLEPVDGPTTLPVLWQVLMAEHVARYRPPEDNVLPTQDNGTHSDAVLLEPTIEQLLTLLEKGIAGK